MMLIPPMICCLDSVTTNLPAECKGDSGGLCVEEFCGKTNPDQKTWNLNLDSPTNGNDIAKKFLNNKSKFCSSSWKAKENVIAMGANVAIYKAVMLIHLILNPPVMILLLIILVVRRSCRKRYDKYTW